MRKIRRKERGTYGRVEGRKARKDRKEEMRIERKRE